ncbi:hypothetical protein STHERM_c13580 [Spirochaeta thermophila DSM 6192]|uniref:Putative auto-transporter adhesin head GIN domain-containing protein n=2 Tax=Winmispira thermophila TaxID=154 RepID=E0RU77_WINT6|nr:hypothetical protein STHERM_c13580 [Spirochaeta thermophila DSM 6192]
MVLIAFTIFTGVVSCMGGPVSRSWGDLTTRRADLSGFSRIEISGVWEVEVMVGEEWSVKVEAPEGLFDYIGARTRGEVLELGWKEQHISFWNNLPTPKATVTLPRLEEVEASGAVSLSLVGLEGGRGRIELSGAGEVTGRGGHLEYLELAVSGAGDVDLTGLEVANAEVDISGAASVRLWVTETLTGSVSGAGSLRYKGDPVVGVDVSEMSSIKSL